MEIIKRTLKEHIGLSLGERMFVYLSAILGVVIPILFFRLILWQVGGIEAWIAAVLVVFIFPMYLKPFIPMAFYGVAIATSAAIMFIRMRNNEKAEEQSKIVK